MKSVVRESWIWIVVAIVIAGLPQLGHLARDLEPIWSGFRYLAIFASGLALTLMCLMGINILLALSYNMLLGQTGMLSFGHAVYYGLAGFIAVHAMSYIGQQGWPIPLPLVPLVGGLAGLSFGIIFGSVSTRRAGTGFAMISLGLAELVAASSLILRSFFGGEEGVTTNRTKLPALLGLKFGPQIEVYYLIAFWTFVCVIAMYAITRTPFGRISNAVRENPERAEFIGYSTHAVRFIAFCLAGFFAGVSGALAAINFELMNALSVGGQESGIVLLMTFIGGVGAFIGPIIGAILITFLQVMLSDITAAWLLYFGVMFILCVMFFPGGIAGVLLIHEPAVRTGQLGKLVPAYALVAIPLALALAGGILLIELSHHMLVRAPSEGHAMHILVNFSGASPVPWVVAFVWLFVGIWLTQKLWPRVTDAWGQVLATIQGRAAA